jgi:hypothetical protein
MQAIDFRTVAPTRRHDSVPTRQREIRSLRLFSLMAVGDIHEKRPLSLKEGADRLGMSIGEARACFADPGAWQTVLELVTGHPRRQ